MFRPLNDRVLVKRSEAQKSKGGILIPDNAQENPAIGVVVSAGPGANDHTGTFVATTVKAGDTVLFGKWSGTEMEIDGELALVLKESDIFGIL